MQTAAWWVGLTVGLVAIAPLSAAEANPEILQPTYPVMLELPEVATEQSLSLDQVSFDTTGVSDAVQGRVEAAVPYRPDEPPGLNGEPTHLMYTFTGPNPRLGGDRLPSVLKIYPVAGLRALYAGHRRELQEMNRIINGLRSLLSQRPYYLRNGITLLPTMEASEVLRSQHKYITFPSGSGIRFLTVYAQDAAPITRGQLFYAFQGLTTDGRYYISWMHPVDTNALAESASLSGDEYAAFAATYEDYVRRVTTQLNMQSADGFFPDLLALDRVIESLTIR